MASNSKPYWLLQQCSVTRSCSCAHGFTYVIFRTVSVNVFFFSPLHSQLRSLVLSSPPCLPPHPPSAHVAPQPTLPHPCRRHTDCQTPCHPCRCARGSGAGAQSPRPSPCWRRQPRLRRRRRSTELHRVLRELALRVSSHQDHTRREGPSPKTRWDAAGFVHSIIPRSRDTPNFLYNIGI